MFNNKVLNYSNIKPFEQTIIWMAFCCAKKADIDDDFGFIDSKNSNPNKMQTVVSTNSNRNNNTTNSNSGDESKMLILS